MDTSVSKQQNKESNKLVKLVEGKAYLEVLMYLIAISGSLVILFGVN